MLNTLAFVLQATDPVIRSDAWYFMQVFGRKFFDGTLRMADFFVKRQGPDHAQPLFKLALWAELRWFHLDFTFEALVGVAGCIACALIFRRMLRSSPDDPRKHMAHLLAWAAICAILFSLNATEIWIWPLVTIEFLTYIPMLMFMWAAWRALQGQRITELAIATLVLAIVDDDSALIAILATSLAMVLASRSVHGSTIRGTLKLIGAIALVYLAVRIGYIFAPIVGGRPDVSTMTYMHALLAKLRLYDIWLIVITPLKLSLLFDHAIPGISDSQGVWGSMLMLAATALFVLHILFWWRALRGRHYNLPTFISVSLMLLVYGWIAGIVLYRIPYFGVACLHSGRYVRFYAFGLIALIMMWIGWIDDEPLSGSWDRLIRHWIPIVSCVMLIAIQLPISRTAWRSKADMHAYYRSMAVQIDRLGNSPADVAGCLPEVVLCHAPPQQRQALIHLLKSRQLNIYSPQVQSRHGYLPDLSQ